MVDAVVVGGGIVGTSTAYHIARAGATVRLFDHADLERATAAGAVVVSPASSRHADPDWYALAVDAARYYPELVEAVRGASEAGYRVDGSLVVAVDDHQRPAFGTAKRHAFEWQAAFGYPPDDALYEVGPEDTRERFPPLADVEVAYYYEGGARVDGRRLTAALRRAGGAEGLDVVAAVADRP